MAGSFKVEHLEKAPSGWKIRTAMSGAHRVRIAFPPGARSKGSGRAVEILHPQGENPACAMNRASAQAIANKFPGELVRKNAGRTGRSKRVHSSGRALSKARTRKRNAAELVIFNPKRKGRVQLTGAQQSRWENYFSFYVQDEGKSDSAADRLAWRDLVKDFPELKKYRGAKNPKRRRRTGPPVASVRGARGRKKLNPDEMQEAIALYEKFHGADPSKILEVQESAAMRSTYAGLGDLVELLTRRADGKIVQMNFEGDRIKVASNPAGTQLYFLGGNQNLNGALAEFEADTTKDFVELGECVRIMYFTRKEADGFQPVDYHHKFGEEGGARPVLIYNKVQRRMILAGGDYKVEAPGIIN